MNIRNALRAAVLLLILTTGLGVYVDIKDHELRTRNVQIRSSLEAALRAKEKLSSMLLIAVLERNILRTRSYEKVNGDLERATRTVAELNRDLKLSDEISALLVRQRQLQAAEAGILELMRSGQWTQAREALLDADFVRSASMNQIDIETTLGAMTNELAEKTELFNMLRVVSVTLRLASLALLLWVGFAYSRQLVTEVLRQTRLQDDLSATQQALRELGAHRDAEGERVRKEVAQEIHDDLGQRLTVLRMDVALLPRAVQADPARLLPRQVDELKANIDGIVGVVRDIAGKLRPAALEVGLVPAAESLLREFQQAMGIPCELHNHLPADLVLDELRTTSVFRILQESMTNAARHARASHIQVSLSVAGRALRLAVQDDGRGFSGLAGGTYGVSGMRERATSLGGTLQISSAGSAGTTVEAWIPLDNELSAAIQSAVQTFAQGTMRGRDASLRQAAPGVDDRAH
jgi:signal transduction histidine kinase